MAKLLQITIELTDDEVICSEQQVCDGCKLQSRCIKGEINPHLDVENKLQKAVLEAKSAMSGNEEDTRI